MEQDILYAQDSWAVLLVFQAMDAAGKDGTIKHVMSRVNPQGVRGPLVQAALRRGAFARFPVALRRKSSAARAHRDLQSLLLRGSSRRARASGAAQGAEDAAEARRQGHLGRAARRHRALRGLSHAAGRGDPQVLPQPVAEGAEEALHGAPRQAGKELEVLRLGRARAPLLGRLHARLRGGDPGDRRRRTRRGSSCPPTTNGSPASSSRRRSSRRWRSSTSNIRRSRPSRRRTSPRRAPSSWRRSSGTTRTWRRRLRFSAASACSCSA